MKVVVDVLGVAGRAAEAVDVGVAAAVVLGRANGDALGSIYVGNVAPFALLADLRVEVCYAVVDLFFGGKAGSVVEVKGGFAADADAAVVVGEAVWSRLAVRDLDTLVVVGVEEEVLITGETVTRKGADRAVSCFDWEANALGTDCVVHFVVTVPTAIPLLIADNASFGALGGGQADQNGKEPQFVKHLLNLISGKI